MTKTEGVHWKEEEAEGKIRCEVPRLRQEEPHEARLHDKQTLCKSGFWFQVDGVHGSKNFFWENLISQEADERWR